MIRKTVEIYRKHTGGFMSPFTAWIMLKGLETMNLRVRAQPGTAAKVSDALVGHAKLDRVIFPGHPSHPQYELVAAQQGNGGTLPPLTDTIKASSMHLTSTLFRTTTFDHCLYI